jgi:hypothetical protein
VADSREPPLKDAEPLGGLLKVPASDPLSAPLPPPPLSGPLEELGGDVLGLGGGSGVWNSPSLGASTSSLPESGPPAFPLFGGGAASAAQRQGTQSPPPPPPGMGSLLGGSLAMGTGGVFSSIWGPGPSATPQTSAGGGGAGGGLWDRGPTGVAGGTSGVPSGGSSTSPPLGSASEAFAPPPPAQNGFHHSLLLNLSLNGPAEPEPPGDAGGAAGDPFASSTESLAKILGLSLPDHADSLAAQAARGGLNQSRCVVGGLRRHVHAAVASGSLLVSCGGWARL